MNVLSVFGTIFILVHFITKSEAGWNFNLPSLFKRIGSFFWNFSDCTTKHNLADISVIQQILKKHLHGQHLGENILISALKHHMTQASPRKSLVLSFHGGVGIGKTYAAGIIAGTLCTENRNSQKPTTSNQRAIFLIRTMSKTTRDLSNWIIGNVSKCVFNLFVIDEIDKMPPGLIDAIKPFVDSVESINGVDFRHCIFIFLSNTGSKEINTKVTSLISRGQDRKSITMKDMEELVQKGVHGNTGGLHGSAVLEHGLVDFYVPFLPLEEHHVEHCIKDEFERQQKPYDQRMVQEVLDLMDFSTNENITFSKYGCRPVLPNTGFVTASHEELILKL